MRENAESWVYGLPIVYNSKDFLSLHEFFIYLMENYLEMIAGEQGENMSKLLAICIKIYDSEASNGQLNARL